MSRAEDEHSDALTIAYMSGFSRGKDAAAEELRRLSAVEAELAECKAAYESQFKELHALKKAISEAEPVAWMAPWKERLEFSRKDTVYGSHTIPLYTLKGIK